MGTSGRPCFGAQHSMCHKFGALFAATMFHGQKKTEAAMLWANCGYQPGVTDVLQVSAIVPYPGDGAFGECEAVADFEHPLAQAGEITQPGMAT